MTAVTLYRHAPTRNMHRFYRLDVQPDLFGTWCLMREWGRMDSPGQTRSIAFATEAKAIAALARLRRAKERRGYHAAVKTPVACWAEATPERPPVL